jgi:hypothetical protein
VLEDLNTMKDQMTKVFGEPPKLIDDLDFDTPATPPPGPAFNAFTGTAAEEEVTAKYAAVAAAETALATATTVSDAAHVEAGLQSTIAEAMVEGGDIRQAGAYTRSHFSSSWAPLSTVYPKLTHECVLASLKLSSFPFQLNLGSSLHRIHQKKS